MITLIRLITFTGLISVCFGFSLPRSVLIRLCENTLSLKKLGFSQNQLSQKVMEVTKGYLKINDGRYYEEDEDSYEYQPDSSYDTYIVTNNGFIQIITFFDFLIELSVDAELGEDMDDVDDDDPSEDFIWNNFLLGQMNQLGLNQANFTGFNLPSLPKLPESVFDGLKPALANSSFPSILPAEIFAKPQIQSTESTLDSETEDPFEFEFDFDEDNDSDETTETSSVTQTETSTTTGATAQINEVLPSSPQSESEFCQQIDFPESLDLSNPVELKNVFLKLTKEKLKQNEKKIKTLIKLAHKLQENLSN